MTSQATRKMRLMDKPSFDFGLDLDRVILCLYITLVLLGLVMVASASIGIADQQIQDPFYYAKRQFVRILMSLLLIWIAWIEAEPVGVWLMQISTSGMADDNMLKLHLIENAQHMRLFFMGFVLLLVMRFSPGGILPEVVRKR